jgi:demethylmenaquinone methyltransferase/2-methoxy-6-polyprenyl-1,4-benzoquinol methylase
MIEPKKQDTLQKMFSAISTEYDAMNRLLTFRLDELWRERAAKLIISLQPNRFLDLCCGTGDLTTRVAKGLDSSASISCMDFSFPMLEKARAKLVKIDSDVHLICADSECMPFPESTFDVIGIAFAFRNLTWCNQRQDQFLSEIHRVLIPDGALIIVETSQPRSVLLKFLLHRYLDLVVATLGALISSHPNAYRYLADSARQYYATEEITSILVRSGFKNIKHRRLLGGVAALTTAYK